VERLFEIGLSNALMSAALAAVAGLAGLVCRRPALVHALWLLVLMMLARTSDPWTALGWATAGYLIAGAATFLWAGDVRTRVRTAEVCMVTWNNDAPTLIRSRVIRSLGATMTRADEQLAAGAISPAEYEATWWRVYDRLAPGVLEAGVR